MKKILTLIVAVFAVMLVTTSCNPGSPEFKFNVEISGNFSSPSGIFGDNIGGNVGNFVMPEIMTFSSNDALPEESVATANDWMDEYVMTNYLSNLEAGTTYEILVNGFVKETHTGIMVSINKVFTNKPQDQLTEVEVIPEGTEE